MTTDAARRAVFNTPEMLENIILFLPVRDVFAKVPRLSRSWKAVVDSSVRASDQALAATSERQCDSAYEVQQRSYLRELQ
jgi:hypothetical protein